MLAGWCEPGQEMASPGCDVQTFLNERAVSKTLGVSLGTLRRWRLRREGPRYVKLGAGRGGAVRYPATALEAWLASRPAGGHDQAEGAKRP